MRHADYDDPASLRSAFAGVDQLLLISSSRTSGRLPQHQAAIDAAKVTVAFVASLIAMWQRL